MTKPGRFPRIGELCIPRTTERIIEFLEAVNTTAANNHDGKPGEFLAELCKVKRQRIASAS